MALLSIFRGTQAECSARPVSDGTLLFATDTKKIYLDKDSSRIEMSSVDDLGNYVTKEQLTTALNGKADTTHTHDDRYYTESEVDSKLSGKANSSHTHTKSQITDFPSSLKNPNSLTISLNGTSQGAYDGSAAKSINVTPASIGAAASSHTHDGRYARMNGSGLTNAWVGIWNGNTSDPGYRLETCWYVNGVQRGLCVETYNRLRFYGSGVNNWSLGNLSGSKDMIPIYRAYNQYDGQHVFVSSKSEYNNLIKAGWTGEGIQFYAFN